MPWDPGCLSPVSPELLNQVQDGIFVLGWQGDPEQLRVLYHNEGFERWLVAQSDCDPQDLTDLPAGVTAHLLPYVQRCRQQQTPVHWHQATAAGLWHWRLLPVMEDGTVIQVQGVCRRQDLPQPETELLAIATERGECFYISHGLRQFLGDDRLPPDFLLNPPYLHPQDQHPVHHAWQTALTQPGHQVIYQCRLRHASGHWLVLEVALTNWLGDPQLGGVVFQARDITQQQQTQEQLQRQNSYLQALHHTSLALLDRQPLQEVLRLITGDVTTLLSAPEGFLFVVDAAGEELVLQVGVGLSAQHQGLRLRRGQGLAGKVWESGQPLMVPNYATWEGRAITQEPSWKQAAAAVPLLTQDAPGSRVIGVLGIAHRDPDRLVSERDQEVLQHFAQLTSLALDHHALYESVQRELRQHRQTQEHLAAILHSIGDGVMVTDSSGRIQLMNRMAEVLTDWQQSQARGHPWQEVLPLIQQPDPVQTVLRSHRPVTCQSLLRDPQGQERYLAASAAPILIDGEMTGVVITFRDITQHKLTELSLRQSESRNRAILDALPDLVFRLDREGHYLFCKGDPDDLVLPVEEVLGKTLSQVLDPENAASWLEQIHITLDQQQMQIHEYPLVIRGEERWYEARLIPISAKEVIAIVRNITQQRRQLHHAEQQRLLSAIALRIRESLDLQAILQTTVAEVRRFGQADRVVIHRFSGDSATVIAESVSPPWSSLLGQEVRHEWFTQRHHIYRRDQPRLITDIDAQSLPPQLRQYLQQSQVQAILTLPLFQGEHLWGLLVLHRCQGSRGWSPEIIQALQHLANQVEIAIQQADLHQQLQRSNDQLERQVRVRTAQLNKQIQALQLQDQILSTVQNAVISIHLAGHITYWNRFAETLYGVSAEAALGELITDIIPFSEEQSQQMMSALRQGQPWSGELTLRSSLEGNKVLLIQHTPTFGSRGELLGAISISMDITRRQEAELALRDSEIRLRTLSETTTAAIFVIRYGHFLDVNPALSHLTGYSRAELLGMSFWHLGHPDCQAEMQAWVEEASPLQVRREFQILTQQGESKWIECTLGKIPYRGFLCDLGTAVDITHRKQLELQMQQQMQELQQLNLLKDDFLSTVSHELRTPMSNMKMSIHMLKKMILEAEKQGLAQNQAWLQRVNRYLHILQDECLREIDLINDLLDLQRLEQTVEPLPTEAIDLQETLAAIMAPFYSRIQERQQSLHLHLSPDLPTYFQGHRSSFIRIFSELINNACKYAPPQASITLSAESDDQYLHVRVSNTGSEIPPEEQERIFEKFYRVVGNDRWKQGGTGLGLALVKKMVEQHQGTISLESRNQQTTFHIHLPLHREPPPLFREHAVLPETCQNDITLIQKQSASG
ncbi:MAG: PAS domain S-box protein [Thermostichales cyanobacterium HHBFW_bins_127]